MKRTDNTNFSDKMKVFIGLLILCGTYSAHSASVGVSQTSLCADQDDGVLIEVTGDCPQSYICLNGEGVLQSCSIELDFDPENNCCIEVSKSRSVDGLWISSSETKAEDFENLEEVAKEEKPTAPTTICQGKAIGAFVPSRSSCSEYYVCIGSTPMLKTCKVGLHFDSFSRACVDPELSNCVVKDVEPVKTEEPVKVVVEEQVQLAEPDVTTTLLVETICLGQPNGAKFAVPGSCSKYFACLQHRAYEKSCGVRHFSSAARSCVDISYSECLEGDAVLEAEEEIEEVVNTQENESEIGKVDEEVNFAKLPKYIVSEGKLILNNKLPIVSIEKTEDAPVDNQIVAVPIIEQTEVVEEPIKAEEPVNVVIDEQLTDSIETTKTLVETTCLGQPNGAKFLVPGTCSKYFVCLQHRAYEKSCGVRHFSSTARSCVDVSYSDCVEGDAGLEVVKTEGEIKDVSNTLESEVGKVDHVETTNTELADHAIHPKYIVSEGKLILNNKIPIKMAEDSPVDNQIIELKTEDSPGKKITSAVNYIEESHIDNADIIVITKDVDGEFEAHDTGVDVEYVDPNHEEEDETTEVVLAVADNESADKCVGVTSGILLPKDGSCRKFITCQDGVAFVGQCPSGLHFNVDTKICDWPELAGCTEVQL